MTAEQAFEVLGIYDRDIDEAALKRAFYEAARNTHPDSNPEDRYAGNRFDMINEAYRVLGEYLKKKATYQTKDKWDYYDQADKRFEAEKKRRADMRAKEAKEAIERNIKREQSKKKDAPKVKKAEPEIEKRKPLFFDREDLVFELILILLAGGFVIIQIFRFPFVGINRFGIYSRYAADGIYYVLAILLARRVTIILSKHFNGKLELFISFLVTLELGVTMMKLVEYAFDGVRVGITSIIIILACFFFLASYIDKIRANIASNKKHERIIATCLTGEYLLISLSGIVFGLVSLVRG